MPKNEEKQRRWRLIIEQFESSGEKPTAFCRERGLALHQFKYYYDRFRSTQKTKSAPPISSKIESESSFKEIRIDQDGQKQPIRSIQILLPNGINCVIPSDCDAVKTRDFI